MSHYVVYTSSSQGQASELQGEEEELKMYHHHAGQLNLHREPKES